MLKNIAVKVQYDGTRYNGWQVQGNTEKTIQGKLEAILKKMTGKY
ncbi:MAG: tRNA pseudouridine(38-40) synthase TruA, partial [Clostridiales bacterium]|nr:tRNA pseudouridine(38-40) synthase TruA [Clostridiales bacterium]